MEERYKNKKPEKEKHKLYTIPCDFIRYERYKYKEPEKEKHKSCVIPGDVMTYHILTRIPLENLVRFRCVCKSWFKLFVDNPLFNRLHSQRYNQSYSRGFMDTEHEVDPISNEYISSLVFINHNGKKTKIIPFNSSNSLFKTKVHILHSLNGVLLLRCDRTRYYKASGYDHIHSYRYYVYNPITCCSTIIPVPISKNIIPDDRHCFCLCYDPLIEKHKVLFCGSSPYLRKIKILTVGDGLEDNDDPWRDIVVPEAFPLSDYSFCVDLLHLFYPKIPIYYIGRYITCDYSYRMVKPRDSDEYYILRLDPSREVYCKIHLPNEVSTLKLKCVLKEMEGLLCLSHYSIETHELKIWTLKKKDYTCGKDEIENEWADIKFNFGMEKSVGNYIASSIHPLAILTVPDMKLIFAHYTHGGASRNSYAHMYSYYSYEIEFKKLELIHGPTSSHIPLHWHVNNFANC